MGKIAWCTGAILVLVGCAASPQVLMRSLPLAGETRLAGTSIEQVSLQEAGVSEREDRFFLTRVSLKNRTGKTLHFGPQHVYLADAGGRLLPRISERWLPEYYDAGIRGIPPDPDRKAIARFPSAEVKLGDATYVAPPLTSGQKGQMAAEVAALVQAAFVRPQRDAPRTFIHKTSEVTLGVLVRDVTLRPDERIAGYVYFYQSAARRPPYPLRLVIELQGEVHAFLFRER